MRSEGSAIAHPSPKVDRRKMARGRQRSDADDERDRTPRACTPARGRPRRGQKRPFHILNEGHSEVFMILIQAVLERRPAGKP
jgi:hypothetical protein